jgi:hypothetical protein
MKISLSIAAAFFAAIAACPTTAGAQSLQQCTGPFRQCAIDVQAQCSRDPNGTQRMTYWDRAGYTVQFERCVGGIFEAAGHPNPYKTGITSSGGLTVPYTELLYPFIRERN